MVSYQLPGGLERGANGTEECGGLEFTGTRDVWVGDFSCLGWESHLYNGKQGGC